MGQFDGSLEYHYNFFILDLSARYDSILKNTNKLRSMLIHGQYPSVIPKISNGSGLNPVPKY